MVYPDWHRQASTLTLLAGTGRWWYRPCAAFTSGSLAQLAHPAPRRTVPGEGPCVDACRQDQVVAEPDLADPVTRRWLAFTPPALRAGARAVFGFPLRVGTVRLGALHLYRDCPGPLSGEQHADALVVADVAARWVLEAQAGASFGAVAEELEIGAGFHYAVHNAAGMVSVQEGISVTEALIRLRAFAFSSDRLLADAAEDVVARRLRLG